jgi:RNA recognition motif-containing protein
LVVLAKSEKDCINWKTKGKCRKGDKCVYKHDPQLQKSAFDKIAKKKRRREEGGGVDNDIEDHKSNKKKRRDEKQPLSVRVFGLNYDTTEADLKEWIETNAGHPVQSIIFPRFEDSNRSKGYCGVYFASPKAAKAAVDTCDSAELHGRWLRVQTGKSMTIDEWEGLHQSERTE